MHLISFDSIRVIKYSKQAAVCGRSEVKTVVTSIAYFRPEQTSKQFSVII